ncbi:hypothetical protein JW898_00875 [Candidatus Woesearchaeota archaeon]|nr:hypothetical protein [Candidatus Woesearchaeota archaeon]
MSKQRKGVKHRHKPEGFIAKVRSVVDPEAGKKDISLLKLVNYNLLFFIPLMVFILFALKIGAVYSDYFEASPGIIAKVFMVPFMALLFFFVIPFIRDRENIAGIRYSIIAFFIIGVGMTLPSALRGDYSLLYTIPNYFGSYILLTFIFCPEVLGIERTLRDWFKHRKQFSIVAIYLSIVLFYVIGFGTLYYDIYNDPANPAAFSLSVDKEPTVASFIYYSMVSFTTTGYGEILPVSTAARLVFFMEALMGLVVNVLFIAILLVFISNAEFLSERREEKEIIKEVKEAGKVLKKEEDEIKMVEQQIETIEREEGVVQKVLNVFVPKK